MRNLTFFISLALVALFAPEAVSQTVPCACMDGSQDGVVTNTDFLPFIMNFAKGDSIGDVEEMGPGLCDPDGDGTADVHDLILFTSLQQQHCEGGPWPDEHLTLLDTAESTFQGWVLELVHEHTGLYMGIPEGAKTYRLYADFGEVPDADLHLIGLWGDTSSPWFVEAPGGLFVADFAVQDEDVLPKQSLIDPVLFAIFPELEFSSFWTTGDMWEDVFGSVEAQSFEFSFEGQSLAFEAGAWSSEDEGGSCMIAVGGQVWHERHEVNGLHLMGQFTVQDGQDFSGQAGLAVGVGPADQLSMDQLMVVAASPFGLSDVEVLGCMDAEASNYDASATYDNGSCEYCPVGDADCDGVVAVTDLLELLGMFGCASDCGWADLDGDGAVGASDILAWLALVTG
jgi:hypothetical protein